jgi:hypothetical protein
VTSVEHNELARSLAGQATVLLQNFGILPLDANTVGKVAVIGSAAYAEAIAGCGGSGQVTPYYHVTPLQGIAEQLGPLPTRSGSCSVRDKISYDLRGCPSVLAGSADECCQQCIAFPSCNFWTLRGAKCYLISKPEGEFSDPEATSGACPFPSNVLYDDGSNLTSAADTASQADVAIVVVATASMEGVDRLNLDFPGTQDELVYAVAAAQPNTIVVCINPGAVLTDWSSQVQAVLAMFMPGQEEGHALADVLFGVVDPGGRLPLTFPNIENEVDFTWEQYPGLPIYNPLNANYSEKLEIGYRYYQSHNIQPKFAFGHGLSYTTFSYSNIAVSGRNVSFEVSNTGSRTGYEVPQMYLSFPPSAGEPPMQLKGFKKLQLAPGETASVTFTVQDRDLSIWDTAAYAFVPQSGRFGVFVGASSGDIRLYSSLAN